MNWWGRLRHGKKLEEQLDKELRFHVEQHASDLMARGYERGEALRRARLEIGGPAQVKESCRDARGTQWLEDLLQDFRYAVRTLRQKPGFSAVALLTLALGIGATTVMFTVVDGVLLRPLPYPEPARLVTVHGQSTTWNAAVYGEQNLAYPDVLDLQRDARSLQMAGSVFSGGGTVTEPGDPDSIDLREITPNLFSVLGVAVGKGRPFLPEENRLGAEPVVILGYSFWQKQFAGNPDAIGKSLVMDGKRYSIVGIAPMNFRLFGEPGAFIPVGQNPLWAESRRRHPVGVVARLQPGATMTQALAEMSLVGRRLAERYPDTNKDRTFFAKPMRPNVGQVRSTIWLLMGAVCLVLLIACANIASLLLARAVSRGRELAMRVALGAGRGRLVRQCLTESVVLGLAGGVLGMAMAAAGLRPFVVFWPGSLPRAEEVHVDWRVLLFAVGASLLSGLLFGLAPALLVPVRALESVLRAGSRSVAASSRRWHGAFVIAEIALAVVLLVSAGMLGRTLLRVSALDPGMDTHNLLIARMALAPAALPNPTLIRASWQDIIERAHRVPGVQAVAAVDTVPMRQGNNQLGYWTSANLPPANQQPMALATSVTPEYLQVMGIPLRQGRFFTDQDRLSTTAVVVIDDVLARSAFGRGEAVGKRLWIPDMSPGPFEVIGVVGHVRHWGLASDDQAQVRAQFYYPFAQVPDPLLRRWSELMSIAVRTSTPPLGMVQALRREERGVGGDQVLYAAGTMEQLAEASLASQRFLLLLFGIFAGLALLLSCIGIYGVLAYLTNQRVPEIGVRMALGASAGDVMGMVLRQSLGMILGGVGLGVAAALAAGRVLTRLVDGVRPTEPSTLLLMIAVLMAAALFASFVPARRASRVDPLQALRQE